MALCYGTDKLLAHSQGINFAIAVVWHRLGDHRVDHRRQAGGATGGTSVNWSAFVFILLWLATFVAGQLLFKRAMESSRKIGFRKLRTIRTLSIGIVVMTISFLLNLGLLQQFDLSYLYPFQGSSIIIVTLLAAILLKEGLTSRLIIGTLLITFGVVLVSLS